MKESREVAPAVNVIVAETEAISAMAASLLRIELFC
jgi:hypothetical protein